MAISEGSYGFIPHFQTHGLQNSGLCKHSIGEAQASPAISKLLEDQKGRNYNILPGNLKARQLSTIFGAETWENLDLSGTSVACRRSWMAACVFCCVLSFNPPKP